MRPLGLYIHVPFCKSICPYCDFYSFKGAMSNDMDTYCDALIKQIQAYGKCQPVNTIFFGGGTPSLLGEKRIITILSGIENYFSVSEDCEITVECNPSSTDTSFLSALYKAKVNRLSFGLQSAMTDERQILGRHTPIEEIQKMIHTAQAIGFTNISLDVMIGIPQQTMATLDETLDFVLTQNIQHISAYMLILEEGTPFFEKQDSLGLPSEEEVSHYYLRMVEKLEKNGFLQYEISNFSKPGYESRHNLKYWNSEHYLGFGPSAHSFMGHTRSYYPSDITRFINGAPALIEDNAAGNFEEYAMLKLRLTKGLCQKEVQEKFGYAIPHTIIEKAKLYAKQGLMIVDDEHIALTAQGFLLSNTITANLLSEI